MYIVLFCHYVVFKLEWSQFRYAPLARPPISQLSHPPASYTADPLHQIAQPDLTLIIRNANRSPLLPGLSQHGSFMTYCRCATSIGKNETKYIHFAIDPTKIDSPFACPKQEALSRTAATSPVCNCQVRFCGCQCHRWPFVSCRKWNEELHTEERIREVVCQGAAKVDGGIAFTILLVEISWLIRKLTNLRWKVLWLYLLAMKALMTFKTKLNTHVEHSCQKLIQSNETDLSRNVSPLTKI